MEGDGDDYGGFAHDVGYGQATFSYGALGDFDAFVYLPGNGYTAGMAKGFLNSLAKATGKRVIFVQLLENKGRKKYRYEDLEPKAYSDHIAKVIRKPGKYVMIGISMGCLHIANFAHYYPSWCYPVMIMLEPTIMQGIYPLLHAYEDGRGNGEWLADLKSKPNNLDIPDNEKVMDISIDKTNPIPNKMTIGVVYTSRSNTNEPYTPQQIQAKRRYYHYLSRHHKTYLLHLDTSHCIDTQPRYFQRVINFIQRVLRVNA